MTNTATQTVNESDTPTRPRWQPWLWAALCGAVLGLAAGVLQPRGPVTPAEAIGLMAAAFGTGLAASRVCRSGWAWSVVCLGHLVGFELARAGSELTTVGVVRLDTGFGVLAFVLGRVLPWMLAWIPIAVGTSWMRRDAESRRLRVRPAAGTVALVLLAGWLALPPTAPVPSGADPREAVAELVEVELGGHSQWVEVRGASRDLPVLLYLSGGPGHSDLAFSRALLEPLTADFLVVGWDQRGAGKSYRDIDGASLTPDRATADTVELARWLCQHYGRQKVFLLGESWGSLLGVLAVQRAPELFHAYVGSGQMADPHETDAGIYRDLVTTAMAAGDGRLVADLVRLGPPPYPSVFDYGEIMLRYPLLEGSYTPPAPYLRRAAESGVGPMGLLGQEYGPLDKVNVLRGLLDMFSVMYPQLTDVDLRRTVHRLEVPVVLMTGRHELAARTEPARQWFDQLDAPAKQWLEYPDAGHSVAFEHAEELHRVLRELSRAS